MVGINAARMAMGLNAEVVVMERSIPRMREIDDIFLGRVLTRYSTLDAIEEEILKADVVIGAVLTAGAAAPKLVKREHLKRMKPGSVLVDVSIDQGGCFETCQADHPRGPDLRGRRRRPLLRRQHARRRAAHLVRGAGQRHPALRPGAGRPRAWTR